MSEVLKNRVWTNSQITALECAKAFLNKVDAGKPWAQIVEELAPKYHDSTKNGNAELQIKQKLQLVKSVFVAKPGSSFDGHIGQSPMKAEWLTEKMKSVGLGKRGRTAGKLSATDMAKVASLLDGFGPA